MGKEILSCNTPTHFLVFFLSSTSHLPNYQGNDFRLVTRYSQKAATPVAQN